MFYSILCSLCRWNHRRSFDAARRGAGQGQGSLRDQPGDAGCSPEERGHVEKDAGVWGRDDGEKETSTVSYQHGTHLHQTPVIFAHACLDTSIITPEGYIGIIYPDLTHWLLGVGVIRRIILHEQLPVVIGQASVYFWTSNLNRLFCLRLNLINAEDQRLICINLFKTLTSNYMIGNKKNAGRLWLPV